MFQDAAEMKSAGAVAGRIRNPGLIRRAANFALATAKHVATGRKLVDDFTREWRLAQCAACPLFDAKLETCTHKQCGCGMKQKRGIIDALGWESKKCPIGKWENPPPAPPSDLSDITICVTSFLRFECLRRFVTSARFYYPGVPIVIADQSGEQAIGPDYEYCRHAPNVTWLEMPFDVGISNARNAAVQAAKTKLICLLDDDHLFTDESRLETLLDVLNSDRELSLVCGVLRMDNKVGNFGQTAAGWFADFRIEGKVLHHDPLSSEWQETEGGTNYRRLHRYINCFVAKRQTLTEHPWDGVHKIANEHLDHCLTLWHSGVKAAYTPNCIFGELHGDSDQYKAFRKRTSRPEMLKAWGIADQQGIQRMEVEPGISDRPTVVPAAESPCIVMLTVGHTGSTMIAGLVNILGWNLPDNDRNYNEPFAIREAGLEWQRTGILDGAKLLADCPRPWVIKDPAFCESLDAWLPFLAEYRPLLIYLERDRAAVEASWERRESDMPFLVERYEAAERHYAYWPWAKQKVQYEDIVNWVASFDLQRAIAAHP